MRQVTLTIPELGLIAGTRGALGAGLALLIADRLSADQRRAVGWTLLAVGVITTFPLIADVFGKSKTASTDAADGSAVLSYQTYLKPASENAAAVTAATIARFAAAGR